MYPFYVSILSLSNVTQIVLFRASPNPQSVCVTRTFSTGRWGPNIRGPAVSFLFLFLFFFFWAAQKTKKKFSQNGSWRRIGKEVVEVARVSLCSLPSVVCVCVHVHVHVQEWKCIEISDAGKKKKERNSVYMCRLPVCSITTLQIYSINNKVTHRSFNHIGSLNYL